MERRADHTRSNSFSFCMVWELGFTVGGPEGEGARGFEPGERFPLLDDNAVVDLVRGGGGLGFGLEGVGFGVGVWCLGFGV